MMLMFILIIFNSVIHSSLLSFIFIKKQKINHTTLLRPFFEKSLERIINFTDAVYLELN